MAWIIKDVGGTIVDIRELHITFQPNQVRDMDLLGRENVERSSEFRMMIQKGYLFEIAKDPVPKIDNQLLHKLESAADKIEAVATQQQKQSEDMQNLKASNEEVRKSNQELATKVNEATRVFSEVKDFVDKFPVMAKTMAEAMRNIQTERREVAEQRVAIQESGASEAEIRAQDRILAAKEQKLQKNVTNLGKAVSHEGADLKDQLKAMEDAGI